MAGSWSLGLVTWSRLLEKCGASLRRGRYHMATAIDISNVGAGLTLSILEAIRLHQMVGGSDDKELITSLAVVLGKHIAERPPGIRAEQTALFLECLNAAIFAQLELDQENALS